jgi:hypothetical protein
VQDINIQNNETEQQMAPEQDDYTPDTYDQYLGAELITAYLGDF